MADAQSGAVCQRRGSGRGPISWAAPWTEPCPPGRSVGLLLPPSVPAALANLGLPLRGRVPVNLNYTRRARDRAALRGARGRRAAS